MGASASNDVQLGDASLFKVGQNYVGLKPNFVSAENRTALGMNSVDVICRERLPVLVIVLHQAKHAHVDPNNLLNLVLLIQTLYQGSEHAVDSWRNPTAGCNSCHSLGRVNSDSGPSTCNHKLE